MSDDEVTERRGRGGPRPGAGRPQVRLLLKLPKDYYSKLLAFSQDVGRPPDEVAANLIMAHLEARRNPMEPEMIVESD